MRHHRLPLHTWLVPLGVVLAVASCDVKTAPGSYFVTYRANLPGGIATIDSVLYSPGTGKCTSTCNADSSFFKVTNPTLNSQGVYSAQLFVPRGATLEAHLYGSGAAAGTAQFTAIWMTAAGALSGDSVTTTTAAATKFVLDIPKRTL
jgi:hypothetical protein